MKRFVRLIPLLTAAVFSSAGALESTLGAAGAAPRAAEWIEGSVVFVDHLNCLTQQSETLTGQYMGYFGDIAANRPYVDEVYYGHVVVSTVGNACQGVHIDVQVILPHDTALVIDPAYPVYCFYLPPPTSENPNPQPVQITTSCPQCPGIGEFGYRYDPVNDPEVFWPLPPGAFLEIQFPLISHEPLNGALEEGAELTGAIRALDGEFNPLAAPYQWIVVRTPDADPIFRSGFE